MQLQMNIFRFVCTTSLPWLQANGIVNPFLQQMLRIESKVFISSCVSMLIFKVFDTGITRQTEYVYFKYSGIEIWN